MADLKGTDPTKPELAILKLLWRSKEMNAREIHGEIESEFGWSYSTVRTVLERMADKGLITKTPVDGVNIYEPQVGKVAMLSRMIADFSKRVLELDSTPATAFFAESKLLSDDELEELESVLKKAETE
ncbi:BlaI/MecI/CopY family transcriptional regulator [Hyphococcus flavus]|uniref:BlaI/MecI/CopY family transcriptional regulator n=1 Tax=Hyphococcus flavus TaxID=1866326 RepID=A0AAE9ZCJ7_9PROT|nr:BlaI/MecI/CopY family transcriptional regulator [Hyphococcus flavus]WDI31981.1 BlaI/MecI/CopY family transcriptional regulator [Hyphococcus flavus]